MRQNWADIERAIATFTEAQKLRKPFPAGTTMAELAWDEFLELCATQIWEPALTAKQWEERLAGHEAYVSRGYVDPDFVGLFMNRNSESAGFGNAGVICAGRDLFYKALPRDEYENPFRACGGLHRDYLEPLYYTKWKPQNRKRGGSVHG